MIRNIAVPLALLSCAAGADLPVRQVILYKNGVGYFERSGTLAAGESARLEFKAADMNDVLKSLTIEEKGAGKVTGVRYDSNEPLDRKLAEFPFKLGPQFALPQVLDQVRGARLELKLGSQTVAGAIAGARVVPGTDKQPERQEVTLLLDGGDIRPLDLAAAGSVRFVDPDLQQKFKDYLGTLAASRSLDKRNVYIESSDRSSRTVMASYMVPTPAWKSSYRLIFGAEGDPVLEGWGIVDNTTGDDWVNIRLALVSGRPVSFISKLYDPKYVQRPSAELAEDRVQAPVVYEAAMAPPPPAPASRSDMARAKAGNRAFAPSAGLQMAEVRTDMQSSVSPETQARELGELFEYRFSNPVTVKKNESAMLPFLQQKIGARKLLIYSEQQGSQNPMSAAELSNNTGKTLDGGPITVFESNAYGGEALMETLKSGDKRMISYGVDLGTRITTKFETKSAVVREIHMNRGILTARTARQDVKTYTVSNLEQKAKLLVIEHPVRQGFTLLSPKPTETTVNSYRWEMRLAPRGGASHPVVEEYVFDQTTAVSSATPDLLMSYVQNKALSDAARKQLERVLQQKRQVAATDEEIRRIETDVNEITRDQQRLRENITSLNRVAGQQEQVQGYAKLLSDQEVKLTSLRDRQSAARTKKAALEAELSRLIESLSF